MAKQEAETMELVTDDELAGLGDLEVAADASSILGTSDGPPPDPEPEEGAAVPESQVPYEITPPDVEEEEEEPAEGKEAGETEKETGKAGAAVETAPEDPEKLRQEVAYWRQQEQYRQWLAWQQQQAQMAGQRGAGAAGGMSGQGAIPGASPGLAPGVASAPVSPPGPIPTREKIAELYGLEANDPATEHLYNQQVQLHEVQQRMAQMAPAIEAANLMRREQELANTFQLFMTHPQGFSEQDRKVAPQIAGEVANYIRQNPSLDWPTALSIWKGQNWDQYQKLVQSAETSPQSLDEARREGFREKTTRQAKNAVANVTNQTPNPKKRVAPQTFGNDFRAFWAAHGSGEV